MVTWQRIVPIALEYQYYEMGVSNKVPPSLDMQEVLIYNSANLVLFWCLKYAVKASFLALYWHIFELSRRFRIAWVLLTLYTTLSFLVTLMAIFWHCGTPDTFMSQGRLR